MADESAFLAALEANPSDDTARLVYADWLDDHDRPDRAEYLRGVSRLAGVGLVAPESGAVLARVGELAATLPAEWTAAAGAAFEVVFQGLATVWRSELRGLLEHEARGIREELVQLHRGAPAVLLDRLRAGDALGAAADLNARLASAVHQRAGLSEYHEERRDLFVSQVERPGLLPFAAHPTAAGRGPVVRRFEVVSVGLFSWNTSLPHQDPGYLTEPLCALLGMTPEDATAFLYSGGRYVARGRMSFFAAWEEFARLRKAFKRHHLSRAFDQVLQLVLVSEEGEPAGETDQPVRDGD